MTEEKNNKDRFKKENNNQESVLKRLAKRFRVGFIVLVVIFLLLIIRLIYIYVANGEEYTKYLIDRNTTSESLGAKRGDILDRNGVQLVTSTKEYTLIVDPGLILEDNDNNVYRKTVTEVNGEENVEYVKEDTTVAEKAIELISNHFGISEDEIRSTIYDNPDRNYEVIGTGLTYNETKEFQDEYDLYFYLKNYVLLEEEYNRVYTYDSLAASVLGFTKNGTGLYGLEYYYDEELSGSEGIKYTVLNNDNSIDTKIIDAVDGYNLVLTIDYNIQSIVEKYIAETKTQTQAESVAVIIQNPNTGEIYAMADSEEFNANDPWDMSEYYTAEEIEAMTDKETTDTLITRWKNYCVTESFEPGSTFKPFTLSAALSSGTTTMSDTFYCEGSKTIYEEEIHCHNTEGHGDLDTKGAIAQSCNVALMDMAEALGGTEFCKMQSRFGFGHSTGIDLPNEMSCHGLLYTIDNMGPVDLATNAFGQNFETTMIQMSTAFCSLINGGNYYKPYVVKSITTADDELVKTVDKTLVTLTVSTEVAKQVKECMRAVVTEGTGKYAAVTGYKIAGKTGTAEIYEANTSTEDDEEDTGYSKAEDVYVISFLGFAPYDSPEVVCYVVVDRPNTGEDSSVASILFSKIMTEVLPYLNIAPDGESTDVAQWERIYDDYTDEEYTDDESGDTEENADENTEDTYEEVPDYTEDGDTEEY